MRPVLLLSLFVLFSESSFAIRAVGNGGGFAEMQAYIIDQALPSLEKACLQNSQVCRLSSEAASLLSSLITYNAAHPFQLIVVNPTCDAPFYHPIGNDGNAEFSIDSCDLYLSPSSGHASPLPRSNGEIAERVLASRLRSVHSNISQNEIAELAKNLFDQMSFQDQQSASLSSEDTFRIHDWSLQSSEGSQHYLTVEGLTKSMDVTAQLLGALKCAQPNPVWSADVFQIQHGVNQSMAQAHIRWSCGEQSYGADLYMQLSLQKGDVTSATLNLFRKQAQ